MGWNSKFMRGIKALGGLLFLSAALLLPGSSANAQLPGDTCITTPDNCYSALCNAYLCLYLGFGKNVAGGIGLISTPGSPSDPGGANFGNLLLWPAPLEPVSPAGLTGSSGASQSRRLPKPPPPGSVGLVDVEIRAKLPATFLP